ncbi:hypothetical protein ACS5PN_11375 [Roseateles sp. NT4]|uniref:hypothetical protein n=1 Tax=Roseateles sp. NT4 TaxID=3453715 RepID=UPI003EECE100
MSDELLTIAEAAVRLDVPRVYASMLADVGKLGPVAMREGGRVVAATAVDAYLQAREQQHAGAPSPREAAAEANLYDLESIDFRRGHTTPAQGNVFADLGFPPGEAKQLLDEADGRLLRGVIAQLADQSSAGGAAVEFDPKPVDLTVKPADLDD